MRSERWPKPAAQTPWRWRSRAIVWYAMTAQCRAIAGGLNANAYCSNGKRAYEHSDTDRYAGRFVNTYRRAGQGARLGACVTRTRRARQREARTPSLSRRMSEGGWIVSARGYLPQPHRDASAWFRAWRVQVFQLSVASACGRPPHDGVP